MKNLIKIFFSKTIDKYNQKIQRKVSKRNMLKYQNLSEEEK